MSEAITIALVDDHRLFRSGLRRLLEATEGIEVVGEAEDGAQFLAMVEAGLRPQVVLLDIDMPRLDGFAVAERIVAQWPDMHIVVLSMHDDAEYYQRMVASGVRGFLLKNSDFSEVLAAIREATDACVLPAVESLSEREKEVLELICQGLSSEQIAERLFISKRTVDAHRANILEKTGAKNTANLVLYAVRQGLI